MTAFGLVSRLKWISTAWTTTGRATQFSIYCQTSVVFLACSYLYSLSSWERGISTSSTTSSSLDSSKQRWVPHRNMILRRLSTLRPIHALTSKTTSFPGFQTVSSAAEWIAERRHLTRLERNLRRSWMSLKWSNRGGTSQKHSSYWFRRRLDSVWGSKHATSSLTRKASSLKQRATSIRSQGWQRRGKAKSMETCSSRQVTSQNNLAMVLSLIVQHQRCNL